MTSNAAAVEMTRNAGLITCPKCPSKILLPDAATLVEKTVCKIDFFSCLIRDSFDF